MSDWFGSATDQWDLLRVYRIAKALPAFPPAASVRSPRPHPDIVVCGDLWETPSLQGAMVSGRKAAETILEEKAGAE
jgi:predicted NAD/FAD-dependent oxidoreductase